MAGNAKAPTGNPGCCLYRDDTFGDLHAVKPFYPIFVTSLFLAGVLYNPRQVNAESPLVDELVIGVKTPLTVKFAEPPRGLVADGQLGLLCIAP